MNLTATPNIALDRTYVVGRVEVGAVHKVRKACAQTGGKGVNVSRTVALLGHPTLVTAGQLAPADVRTAEPQVETQLLGKAAARP
jgi:fructose-1-phosphate kinase PfkB-like protein